MCGPTLDRRHLLPSCRLKRSQAVADTFGCAPFCTVVVTTSKRPRWHGQCESVQRLHIILPSMLSHLVCSSRCVCMCVCVCVKPIASEHAIHAFEIFVCYLLILSLSLPAAARWGVTQPRPLSGHTHALRPAACLLVLPACLQQPHANSTAAPEANSSAAPSCNSTSSTKAAGAR
jgi:hypothetical protein